MNLKNLINGEITQQELFNYYNVCVTYLKLPNKINGFVFCYKNICNIFIDSELSYYKKKKTLLHELAHIELNHLCQTDKDLLALNIAKYEDEADTYIAFLKNSL